ncbi:hypothetical protein MB02_11305 [Croceicoccus estronivorus]|uniref:alpha/beta hydrolase n=1 Tax=Croceicoccus estronivorus TaxID=1172626 RepID=UPI0008337B10|nr:alpha/beta hydrolase [Croceicoccus estronivorus]OCC23735.1 hypothetical protein MB02_11305 [Croceicoccus estronivorus]
MAEVSLHGDPAHPLVRLVPRASGPARELFYLHGGAHAFEINGLHWRFITKLIRHGGFTVSVPLFPLIPRASGAEISAHVRDSYLRLRKLAPGMPISIVGDSAGAGLALGLALDPRNSEDEMPSALVLVSPWLDLELADADHVAIAPSDPLLDLPGLRWTAQYFAGDRPLHDPAVSPINGELSRVPPALIITGSRDLLSPDARRLAALAGESGRKAELLDRAGMVHNWPFLPIPEAQAAVEEIVRFLTENKGEGAVQSTRQKPAFT